MYFIFTQSDDGKESIQMPEDDSDENDIDDIVYLGTSRRRVIVWHFPQVKQCPNNKCNKIFPTRAMTIEHFKMQHAKKMTFCKTCDKLLCFSKLKRHEETSAHRLIAASKATYNSSLVVS